MAIQVFILSLAFSHKDVKILHAYIFLLVFLLIDSTWTQSFCHLLTGYCLKKASRLIVILQATCKWWCDSCFYCYFKCIFLVLTCILCVFRAKKKIVPTPKTKPKVNLCFISIVLTPWKTHRSISVEFAVRLSSACLQFEKRPTNYPIFSLDSLSTVKLFTVYTACVAIWHTFFF